MGNSTDNQDRVDNAEFWFQRIIGATIPRGEMMGVARVAAHLSCDHHRALWVESCEEAFILRDYGGLTIEDAWRVVGSDEKFTPAYWVDWKQAHLAVFSETEAEMVLQA